MTAILDTHGRTVTVIEGAGAWVYQGAGLRLELPARDDARALEQFNAVREPGDPAGPAPVPATVTRRQGMAVLIKYGIDVQVDAALNAQLAAATASGDAALILRSKFAINDWRESQQFERDWPLIGAMQQVFGWSDAKVDSLFVEAASL